MRRVVQILGFDVEVIYTDDLPDGNYGHCRSMESQIRISDQIPKQQQSATLIHEAMHFVWAKTRDADDQLNEEEVCTLVECLAPLMFDE